MAHDHTKKRKRVDDPKSKIDLLQFTKPCELFHTPDGTAYVSFPVEAHTRTAPLRSAAFRAWLAQKQYASTGKPAPKQSLQDTIELLNAKSLYESPEEPIFTRVGAFKDGINIDLCTADWRAVRVTAEGWRIVDRSDVRFRRSKGMLPLPKPARHGDIHVLRNFLNLADKRDWKLALGWLLATFMPRGPYPILLLQGEHGTAKSTNARILRSLVDPNIASLRARPHDERDLMIAGTNSWVLAFDNLSGLKPDLADSLCRVSTGGGFGARLLYSDDEEHLFDIMRPVLLTGIDALATREDLVDRSILLTLPLIGDERRQSESDFWKEFGQAQEVIFGGLLDTLVAILRIRDTIKLAEVPRMADFAIWGTAAEQVLGWPSGSFMKAYNNNRETLIRDAAESDFTVTVVREFLEEEGGSWEGTATDLLEELNEVGGDRVRKDNGWPRNANWLVNRLRRRVGAFRAVGIDMDAHRSNGTRLIALKTKREEESILR